MPATEARRIMDQTRAAIADFPAAAKECGVTDDSIKEITTEMERTDRDVRGTGGRDP